MRKALRRIASLLSILFVSAGIVQAQTSFNKVYVFGDSLSDTGNVAHQVQSATGGLVRYPADNPALKFDYTDGRFTDGKDTQPAAQAYFGVWIEQLAASFPGSPAVTDSLDGGTNYAFGDATTATSQTTLTEGPISITIDNIGQQVADYFADVANKKATAPTAQTLYVLWGGADDLLAAAQNGADPVAAAQTAVQNELALVQQLVSAGATSFVIPNIPPLGATPEYASGSMATALNNGSALFAQLLAQGLASAKQSAAANGVTVTFYQPDILDRFVSISTTPMMVGLGLVSTAAQNVAGSPDTYLVWDGLHPTTTGHHFAAALAGNLITPLLSSTTALISPPTAVLAGQATTLTAKVTSTAGSAVPTGLVTFYGDTDAIGSGTLDATGTATAVIPGGINVPGTYGVTAVYAGDMTYNTSISPSVTAVSLGTAIATTTTLSSSAATVGTSTAVTFTATVTPAVSTYGPATGTVTFLNGSTTLGTGTLANGVATYTASTLPAGTLSITASYPATLAFGASTSAALIETVATPSFTPSATPSSLTISDGASGTTSLTAASVGGYTGTLTLACGTVPAHLSCSFSATTLTLAATGSPSPVTLTIATNATAGLAVPAKPGAARTAEVLSASLLLPGCAGLVLLGRRRRRLSPAALRLSLVMLGVLTAVAAAGLTGCGGNGSSNNASPGTYMVPVTFTPSTGAAQTVNVSVTVQ